MLYIGTRLCLSISFVHLDVFVLHSIDSIIACCTPRLGTILLRTTARPLWVRVLLLSMPGYYASLVHIVDITVVYGFFLSCLPLLNQCP